MEVKKMEKGRCWGNRNEITMTYHDTEWGVPSHDDRHLFELRP